MRKVRRTVPSCAAMVPCGCGWRLRRPLELQTAARMCIIKNVLSKPIRHADVVQLVERQLPKLNVAGSSPVVRSRTQNFPSRQGSSTNMVLDLFCLQNGHQKALFSFRREKDFTMVPCSCMLILAQKSFSNHGGILMTLAVEFANLERDTREKKNCYVQMMSPICYKLLSITFGPVSPWQGSNYPAC
jgi:hypothetical protein